MESFAENVPCDDSPITQKGFHLTEFFSNNPEDRPGNGLTTVLENEECFPRARSVGPAEDLGLGLAGPAGALGLPPPSPRRNLSLSAEHCAERTETIEFTNPEGIQMDGGNENLNHMRTNEASCHDDGLDLHAPPTGEKSLRNMNFSSLAATASDGQFRSQPLSLSKVAEDVFNLKVEVKTENFDHTNSSETQDAIRCFFCQEAFLVTGHYIQHLKKKHRKHATKQHKVPCDICGKGCSNIDSLLVHRNIHMPEKRHHCDQCELHFGSKAALKEHERTHSNERPFTCSLCPSSFRQKSTLMKHQRHVHEKIQNPLKFACTFCDKIYRTKHEQTTHISHHTGNKPFQCEICGLKFAMLSSKNYHQRQHSREKIKCDICLKDFRFKVPHELKKHKEAVHFKIKPHGCEVCKKSFAEKHNLRRHMKIHEGLLLSRISRK